MRLAALSLCAFLATFAAAGWVLTSSRQAEPAQYPVAPEPPIRAPYRFALIDRFGSPFFTDRELLWYEWKTHTFALGPAVPPDEKWRRCGSGLMDGTPFAVVADGVVCYPGAMFTDVSSVRKSGPIIYVHPRAGEGVFSIEVGHSTPDYVKSNDPRNDERVRAALRAVGKLRE